MYNKKDLETNLSETFCATVLVTKTVRHIVRFERMVRVQSEIGEQPMFTRPSTVQFCAQNLGLLITNIDSLNLLSLQQSG